MLHPLISTKQAPFTAADRAALAALFGERDGLDLNRAKLIQSSDTPPDYSVKLLELTVDGTAVARYGYQVLDEQARLDPHLHRSANRDDFGQSAAGIPLFGETLLANDEAADLLALSKLPATPLAFAQSLDSTARRAALKPFFGLRDANDEDIIPAGLPGAGQPKYNLNDLATDPTLTPQQRAETIAAIIDRHLPLFKTRDPSLRAESTNQQLRYLNRLAASMVDYIDPDNLITTANDGEPAGRGLFPLVVSVAEQYLWHGGDANSAVIRSRAFIQVWNPYTVTVSGSARIRLTNRQRVNFGSGIVTPLNDYDSTTTATVSVRPNEFKVIAFDAVTQTFTSPTPGGSPRWAGSPADTADQTTHEPFEFFWNGTRVDMHRRPPLAPGQATAGLVRNAKTLEFNKVHYQVNSIPTYANLNVIGDPRNTYLSNYDWPVTTSADASYANNTYWNGRSPRDGVFPYTQDFVNTWAQRDFIRANPPVGLPPNSIDTAPDEVSSPYDETRDAPNAPFYIRKNRMLSIGELGHIFDPAQANNGGNAPSGGTPNSVFVSGGGRTLRIGQPEFAYWDHDGMRAVELLDIFTVNPVAANSGYPEMAGRININTAPKAVLEALFTGIEINSDQGVNASKLDASRLANTIISERQSAPFKKLSDLRRILPQLNRADAYQPALGDGANDGPPRVMDRAREEAFAKFCNLVTVQSRNYRVYAVGQALAANGEAIATTWLEAVISVSPEQQPDGKTVFKPKIIHVYYQ